MEKSFYKEYTNTELENSLNNIEDNLFTQLFIDNDNYESLSAYNLYELQSEDPIRLTCKLILPVKEQIINNIISFLNIDVNDYDNNISRDIINHFINSGDRFNNSDLISKMVNNWLKYKANKMATDLNKDNTEIGKIVDIDSINIDVFNRDGLFLYIDGIIKYTMNRSKTHADLINDIINDKKFNFYRPKYDDITELFNDKNMPLAFGHIVKNIGFIIETYNCDEYDVAEQAIKNIPPVTKVFSELTDDSLIRLANLQQILEDKNKVDMVLKNVIDKFFDLENLKILAKDNDITDIQYIAMNDFNVILEDYADGNMLQYLSNALNAEINYDNLDILLAYIKENSSINTYWINHVNTLAKVHAQNTLEQLSNNNDKIGDTIENDQMSFDAVTRDKAILYLNGKVYTDNQHVDIINKLYNQNFELEYTNLKEYNAKSYAIGSLMNDNIAIFYDDTFFECTPNEVANKVKDELNVKKVYLFSIDKNTLTRYASKAYNETDENTINTAETKVFYQLFINQELGYEYLNQEKFNTVYKMTDEQTLKFLSSKYEDEIIDAMFETLNINPDDYDENLDIDIIDHFSTSQAILNTNLLDEYFALWTDKKAHDDIQILSDSDIAIGRTLNLGRNTSHIDVFNRDGVFIYLDGNIKYSTEGLSHGQLLNKIMDEDVFDFKRPSIDQVQYNMGYDNNTPVAFGHIVGDIALIDTHENVDLLTVGKAALEIPGINKAFTNPYHGITTRLAKKVI